MSVKYNFSIANDTLNGIVNSDRLTEEIYISSIVTALDYIETSGDDCGIWFKVALSSPDQTTLSGVVATHNGEPLDEAGNVRLVDQDLTSIVEVDDQGRLKVTMETTAEPHTLSGTLHLGQLSNNQIPDYITRDSELTTTSGYLQVQIDNVVSDVSDLEDDLNTISGALGSQTFLGLTDTPSSYSSQANKYVRTNSAEDALVFDFIYHSDLSQLDYASSGHTGFASSIDLFTVSGSLSSDINNHTSDNNIHFTEASIDHGNLQGLGDDDHPQYHNDTRGDIRYYTKFQVNTISGSLQSDIDGKADLVHTHVENDITDLDKYTQAEVDDLITSVSGSILEDHGALTGLSDDDHPQYHNDTRGDLRYYTKSQIDTISGSINSDLTSHTGDSAIHFTESSIDHTNIDNIGTNSHSQIDTHISDGTLHFTEGSIDHGSISGLGDDDHPQYHNDVRGDARYYTKTQLNNGQLDNRYYTEAETNVISGSLQSQINNKFSIFGGTVFGNTTINGNLTVTGTQFIANVEEVDIKDNLLLINSGETGPGVTIGWAGIEIDRGTLSNYQFIFDEVADAFKVGISGSLQPVATRKDSSQMTNNYVVYWEASNSRLVTDNSISYDQIASLDDLSSISGSLSSDFLSHINDGSIHFTESSIDHGNIQGLGDDDHTQYILSDGTRDFSGIVGYNNNKTFTSDTDIVSKKYVDDELAGFTTDHGGLTGLGDDDHSQYTLADGSRDFTGKVSYNSHPTFTTDTELVDKKYVDDEIDNLTTDHGELTGLGDDDHTQYILANGSRAFSGTVSGVSPTTSAHLATKGYVDAQIVSGTVSGTVVKNIPAGALLDGTTSSPGTATAGPISARVFDDTSIEYLYGSFDIPSEYISNTDIIMNINLMNDDAQSGTRSCVFRVSYHIYDDGDTYGSKTDTAEDVTISFPNNASAGVFKTGQITLDYNDSNNPLIAGETVVFRIERRATSGSDTLSGDAALILISNEIEVRYE